MQEPQEQGPESDEIPLTEAAVRLGKDYGTVWKAALSGKLTARRRWGRWFVTERSVSDYRERAA